MLFHVHQTLKTATLLESGRDDGHLAPPLPGGSEGIEHAFAATGKLGSCLLFCIPIARVRIHTETIDLCFKPFFVKEKMLVIE
jgi:hypothetical protein